MQHEQVFIKVNATCDKGIAPLVAALNTVDGVFTLDSCQKGTYGEAYVFFTYGTTWQELAYLLQRISSYLSEIKVACGFALRLEWFGSNEYPRAQIVLEPVHVGILAAALEKFGLSFSGHKSQSIII